MDDTWIIKQKDDWALLRNDDMDCNIGLIHLISGCDKSLNEELFDCIKKSFQEYYRPSRKNKIIIPEILNTRHLVFGDTIKGISMSDFILRKNEDITRDFKLASQLERGITEYYKKGYKL